MTPTSVQVGSNQQTAPRYYYVYNGHGDVVNLADANGNVVASYSYDEFGVALSSSESFPGGWSNPYRYDGRDDVRFDTETALNWMSVRAYDPTLGRFISRDPLGRAPLMGWTTQPYAYAGNNPLVNVDPSGQRLVGESGAVTETVAHRRASYGSYYHVQARKPYHPAGSHVASHKIPHAAPGQPDCNGGSEALICKRAARVWNDALREANSLGLTNQFVGIFASLGTVFWKGGPDAFREWLIHSNFMGKLRAAASAYGVHALVMALGGWIFGKEADHDLNWFTNPDNVKGFLGWAMVGVTLMGLVGGTALVGGGVWYEFWNPVYWSAVAGWTAGFGQLVKILGDQEKNQLSEYSWTPPVTMVSCESDPTAWSCSVA